MAVSNTTAVPSLRVAPGPRGQGLFGSLARMRKDPIGLMMDSLHAFGDVTQLRLAHRRAFLLAHPDHVKHVFQDNHRNYNKQTRGFQVLRTFLANGLLTSEGAYWRRQRRIAQPAFHRARIAAFGTTMTRATDDMLDRWHAKDDASEMLDISAEMMRLTLRIVSETLFSTNVCREADQVGAALVVARERARDAIYRVVVFPPGISTPRNRRVRQALRTLDTIVYRLIEQRRRSADDAGDLLSMLMHARDEETGESMTDQQLRDEVMTILLAGHETTAVALFWTWYLLSKYPDAARKLRSELKGVLGGRTPTVEDLPKLQFTEQVIKESMRLYPPAWIISRCAIDDDEVGGYRIPGGSFMFLSPYMTHRHPAFWDNPEGFDPDRFEPGRLDSRPPFAYFPFGGGPRQCIGNGFAIMELQLVVATMAQRVRLDLMPGLRIELAPVITLRPQGQMLMTVRTVDGSDA